jgi:DNA-directed RNA polymerase specialized sigma subunit
MNQAGPGAGGPERSWEARLIDARRSWDPAERAALIEEFMPLANRLAWRSRRSNDAHDDLVQVAYVGRVKAVDRFDPEHGADHALALKGWVAELPQRRREILRPRFEEDLTQPEIADRVGISQMHVSRLLRRSLERLRVMADPR